VITAAISVSESCLPNATIGGCFGLPLSTMSIWPRLGAGGDLRAVERRNTGGMPLPLAWWQATQFAA